MNNHSLRLVLVMSFLFALFGLLLMSFFQIQIVDGKKWALLGKKQHYFEVREPPSRGVFYAGKTPLVFDLEIWHLFVDAEAIPEEKKKALEELLKGALELNTKEVEAAIYAKSRSRRLKDGLTRQEKESLFALWLPFAKKNRLPKNALYAVRDYQRSYPFGFFLGQVLHTIQGVKEEGTKQGIPTGGLELSMNESLKGKGGRRLLMRSPRNAFETGDVIEAPEAGADVQLTVNTLLQAICEEELKKGVDYAGAKGGVALMMNPKNGEILALAHYPFFDPSRYQEYFNDPEKIEQTKVKAVTDAHELGSVMKPLTAALALKANQSLKAKGKASLFDPDERIKTHTQLFPGRKKPIKDTKLHTYLNMDMAIQKSSNVYAAILVDRILKEFGAAWYRDELVTTFGFGKKSGIELQGESAGVVPRPSRSSKEWSLATPYSMAFGHNIQTTSVQLVRAISVLVNGGYLVQPHLVRQIGQGEKTVSAPEKVLDEEICHRVVRSMKFVTKPGGSAPKGDVFGFTEGGKSGTANKVVNGAYSETKYVSSFVGFAPAENTAFVLLVTLDEPEYGFIPGVGKIHHGGVATGPIFSEIARRSLEVLGVRPDDPFGYAVNDPRYNRERADYRREALQLQEMYEKWNRDEAKKIN